MTVRVRRGELADANRLADINIAAWRAAYTGLVTQSRLDGMEPAAYRERWNTTLLEGAAGGRIVLVAEIDGLVTTYCVGGSYRPQEDATDEQVAGWGEIYAIYTDPAMWGRGAGTAVHKAFLDEMHGRGYEEAALWVLRTNVRSQRWYAARGWRADGAVTDWLSGGVAYPEIRLRMSLPS